MRFTPHLLDEIRARLPVSQIVARKVKLKRQGREFIGLSPFKTEKTPSFTVNDQKGFYHCFATSEHGDIFTFLMKTEGLDFPEAVERLAEEAGVELPKLAPPTPEVQAQLDTRERLYQLVEVATEYFCANLRARTGQVAREYLERRGLSAETISNFRLGYAVDDRTALLRHLSQAGFSESELITSGMIIGGQDIREPYDRFRHRVMFPITDPKGRVIAFGGRALDPQQPAKYLNSNDTPLFHKGRVLFNMHRARQAAYENSNVIAVEGYMDVIALSQAGFHEAVAPLGTALTEEQLGLLWRMSQEPILCFDGDSAGRKAAFRAVDTALPHLKPGFSLRFAFLADGADPDDVVREAGATGLQAVLDRASPLADVLFEREWSTGDWSTPERRAGLEQQLSKIIAGIPDHAVRQHYDRDMKDRLFAAWRTSGPHRGTPRSQTPVSYAQPGLKRPRHGAGGDGRPPGPRAGLAPGGVFASESLKQNARAAGQGAALPAREALILQSLLNHPFLVDEYAEDIAALQFTSQALCNLRDAILCAHAMEKSLDSTTLRSHLQRLGSGDVLLRIEQLIARRSDRFAEPDAEADAVREGFEHVIALQQGRTGLSRPFGASQPGR